MNKKALLFLPMLLMLSSPMLAQEPKPPSGMITLDIPLQPLIDLRPFVELGVGYYSKNDHVNLYGAVIEGKNEHGATRSSYLDFSGEKSVWFVLFGVSGLAREERVSDYVRGLQFNADYLGLAYGGKTWLGFKAGSFHKSFIALRAGRGYMRTYDRLRYKSPSLEGAEDLIYGDEYFWVDFLSGEMRIAKGHLAGRLSVEQNWYRRELDSPDVPRFGYNKFQGTFGQASLEIIPSLKHDAFRAIVQTNRSFVDGDAARFTTIPSEIQVFLRIAF